MSNILAIDRSGLLYGSAFNLLQWAKIYLRDENCKITLLLGEDGGFAEEAEKSGIEVIKKTLPPQMNTYGKVNLKLTRLIKIFILFIKFNYENIILIKNNNQNFDTIIFNNYRSYVYYFFVFLYLKLICRKKVILRLQISDTPLILFLILAKLLFSKIIVHGTQQYAEREFGKKFTLRKNVICLPNPVDSKIYKPNEEDRVRIRLELDLQPDQFVFISVSYIEPRKGVLELMKSFSEIEDSNAVLIHIGDHGEHVEYFKQVSKYRSSNTILLGRSDKVAELLRVADCFVLFSQYEGMPYVICEAMATGLPIITTYAGSNADVVTEDCGVLVKWNDTETLKKTMQYVIQNRELFIEKGFNSRKRVEQNYSIDKYIEKLKSVY